MGHSAVPLLACLLTMGAAFLCSWVATRWALKMAPRCGAFEMPEPRKIHTKKIPNLGWAGIFLGWFTPLACVAGAATVAHGLAVGVENPYLEGMMRKMPVMGGIAAGALWSVCIGWVDDRRKLLPASKIVAQVGLAVLLIVFGVRVLPGQDVLGVLATVGWVLCVMNAVNLLDNLDGVCAAVALLASLIFFCVAVALRQYFIALLLAAFSGGLGGFLFFNFPPATIFMGNAGSSLVGYLLAVLTILETSYSKRAPSHWAMVMPFLLLAVPIYDTGSVICIRLRRGLPLTIGDTNHFAHRLLRAGKSPREALGIICAITFAAGLGALFLPFVSGLGATLIIAAVFSLFAGLALWEMRGI